MECLVQQEVVSRTSPRPPGEAGDWGQEVNDVWPSVWRGGNQLLVISVDLCRVFLLLPVCLIEEVLKSLSGFRVWDPRPPDPPRGLSENSSFFTSSAVCPTEVGLYFGERVGRARGRGSAGSRPPVHCWHDSKTSNQLLSSALFAVALKTEEKRKCPCESLVVVYQQLLCLDASTRGHTGCFSTVQNKSSDMSPRLCFLPLFSPSHVVPPPGFMNVPILYIKVWTVSGEQSSGSTMDELYCLVTSSTGQSAAGRVAAVRPALTSGITSISGRSSV